MQTQLGKDIIRKEAWSKVGGAAEYTADNTAPGTLFVKLLTSPHAHAEILSIDPSKAAGMPGVKSVITGKDVNFLCGVVLRDRPALARDKVRYFGEPVALVVADSEQRAKAAAAKIQVVYQPLPPVNSVVEALNADSVLIHQDVAGYQRMDGDVDPIAGTNICHCCKVRKGDMEKGWAESDVILEGTFQLPQSGHAAMETRAAACKIDPDGRVVITSSSQAPFSVKEDLSEYFNVPEGNVIVKVPFVGGGFGGKAAVYLETLAYLAARAVPGRTARSSCFVGQAVDPCHFKRNLHKSAGMPARHTGQKGPRG